MASRDLASMGMLLLIFLSVGSAHSRLLLDPSEGISPSALLTENRIQPVDDWKHDDHQASELLEKPAGEPEPWGYVTRDGDDLEEKPVSEPWDSDHQTNELLKDQASEPSGYVPPGPADLEHPASEPESWDYVTRDGDDLFEKPGSEPWDLDRQTDELFKKQASESWGYASRGSADLDHPASEPEPWRDVMRGKDQLFERHLKQKNAPGFLAPKNKVEPADDDFTGELADINPEINQ